MNGSITDEALFAKAIKGDRKAFEGIYDRYSGRLYNYFLKMLNRNAELAKDQTQELFLKLLEKGQRFDEKRVFKTWVFSIANNMCKNIYRKNEVKRRADKELKLVQSMVDEASRFSMDEEIFKSALKKELENFDVERRSIFILRFKQQFTVKEIAEITGIAEGTVKSKIFYSLKKLQGALIKYNPK